MESVESLREERDNLSVAANHLRTMENQSAHQQALLEQMKSRIQEHE